MMQQLMDNCSLMEERERQREKQRILKESQNDARMDAM